MSTATATASKTVGVILTDLATNFLTLPSRQSEKIQGEPVLRRTVWQVRAVENLDEVIVFCPSEQREQVAALLSGIEVEIIPCRSGVLPRRLLAQRKWALESWRGGIREAAVFDEWAMTKEHVEILRTREIVHVLIVPGDAAFADTALLKHLIEHHHEHSDAMRFTFSQAAPGLGGCVYRMDLLADIISQRAHIGDLLCYHPNAPAADFVNAECTYRVAGELCTSPYRYLVDTRRNLEKLRAAQEAAPTAAAANEEIPAIIPAMQLAQQRLDDLPRELEIEINTAISLRMLGYPHRRMNGKRKPMTLELFTKIVNECRGWDDICLTIGGCGEPLAHPDLLAMIQAAKAAGIYGINIETDGLLLKGNLAEALLASPVDIISVYLDADDAQMYQKLKGSDAFAAVTEQIERFIEKARSKGGEAPMIIPHLVKTRETISAMEPFYDRWLERAGGAVIVGYNDYAGQIENLAVMDMSGPQRRPCSRLGRQMSILADGTIPLCSQDYEPRTILGDLTRQSVGEIWRGDRMTQLRRAHENGDFNHYPLCQQCKEWHR